MLRSCVLTTCAVVRAFSECRMVHDPGIASSQGHERAAGLPGHLYSYCAFCNVVPPTCRIQMWLKACVVRLGQGFVMESQLKTSKMSPHVSSWMANRSLKASFLQHGMEVQQACQAGLGRRGSMSCQQPGAPCYGRKHQAAGQQCFETLGQQPCSAT